MLVFGLIGYLMRKLGFSFVPFIIGFVLGPMFELSLRQSVILSGGDVGYLLDHPVALVFLALAALMILRFSLQRRKDT
jgi:putative tricarboxylic transport membrane protein